MGGSLEAMSGESGVGPFPKGEPNVADGQSGSSTALLKLHDLKQLFRLSESLSQVSRQGDFEDKASSSEIGT